MEHDKSVLDHFVEDFVRVLEKHARYLIVSGFLAIASGRARGTEDIDVIIERISKSTFMQLHAELLPAGFECMQGTNPNDLYDDYLSQNLSLRYHRKDKIIPNMEIKFSKDILDEYQLRTRKKLPQTGLDFYFSSVEGTIAFKEELLKSPKDMEDAKHLRIVYGNTLSEDEIKNIKRQIRRFRL